MHPRAQVFYTLVVRGHTGHLGELTACRASSTVFHMKTTLVIDDRVDARLRAEAARQKRNVSELVEAALRLLLDRKPSQRKLPPLPHRRSGGFRVDVSDRDALYRAMDGR